MFSGIAKEGRAFGESLATVPYIRVWKSPGLNLRFLYSARERESIDRLGMMVTDLNGQNYLLISPARNWMRIKKREGRSKGPAS